MDFLEIYSLGITYQYVVNIAYKFKKKKQEFGSTNSKQGKSISKPQNKGLSQEGKN